MSGRKAKKGFDFFALDVDLFNDVKIQKLIRAKGAESISVYLNMLCRIYKSDGYYIKWDDSIPCAIAMQLECEESYVSDVLEYCMEIDLFDGGMYNQERVITSNGLQSRYSDLCITLRRKGQVDEYKLVPISSEKIKEDSEDADTEEDGISVQKCALMRNNVQKCTIMHNNEQKLAENSPSQELFPSITNTGLINADISIPPKSKEKNPIVYTIGKEKKENAPLNLPNLPIKKDNLKERKEAFKKRLEPYLDKYGPDMLNEFYAYWTMHNDNGYKMRFEMEKIFNTAGRLATWARNNRNKIPKGGGRPQKGVGMAKALGIELDMSQILNPQLTDGTERN